jgi:predicted DNA-binding transcriptional regulator AlpA
MNSKLLNVNEVADALGVSSRTVWCRGIDMGAFPHPVRIGKSVRWNAVVLDQWIQAGYPDVRKTGWVPTMAAACCNGGGK